MLQYLRKVRATFNGGLIINPGGINPHDIRIEFSIDKDSSSSPNSAEITIFNLSESHRNSVGKEFDNITLEAGYIPPDGDGNVGVIFKGAVRDVVDTARAEGVAAEQPPPGEHGAAGGSQLADRLRRVVRAGGLIAAAARQSGRDPALVGANGGEQQRGQEPFHDKRSPLSSRTSSVSDSRTPLAPSRSTRPSTPGRATIT